ncbi:MAG: ABC transporter ATP-binding protein, partial [Candidatus Limiplasma sp.]|nr:ABC transporter ATP-binding protein [Candidatus Limiplasma sp.]
AIVGRNGAGKSTLSKLICGFETPDEGTLLFEGRDIGGDSIRERAAHIGYVMQNPNQMISKTMIYDEVALGLAALGLSEEETRARVEDTLRVCGLYPFRNWPISALSFGQKKRVTIASVLAMGPELIILDEPTAGQDFKHYTEIMEFLRGLNAQGVTVVMITHDMHLMLEYTPRALVFSEGRLIADRSAAAVLCDPELVGRAALKETSLFTLAGRAGIAPPEAFVERFIAYDREVRSHGRHDGA